MEHIGFNRIFLLVVNYPAFAGFGKYTGLATKTDLFVLSDKVLEKASSIPAISASTAYRAAEAQIKSPFSYKNADLS